VLLNIALHGMEEAAGVRYLSRRAIRVDSPAVIRYADDCAPRTRKEELSRSRV